MTTTSLSLLFLLAFLIGGLISWLIIQLRLRSNYLPLAEMEKDFVRRE
ncbi:MAG: DNA recombination protein RmuC, partial [Neolewinella sp.]